MQHVFSSSSRKKLSYYRIIGFDKFQVELSCERVEHVKNLRTAFPINRVLPIREIRSISSDQSMARYDRSIPNDLTSRLYLDIDIDTQCMACFITII